MTKDKKYETKAIKDIMNKRDIELDMIRGIAILYIMFIHTIYNQGMLQGKFITIFKSFFLFEMPIFFIITGASLIYEKVDNLWEFYKKRFQKILIPYYIFAVIVIILNFIYYRGNYHCFSIFEWILPFLPKKTFGYYFTNSLWFITTYLLVILFIPYLKRYYLKNKKENSKEIYLPIFYIIIYFILKDFIGFTVGNFTAYFNYLLCYTLFTYIGFFWQNLKKIDKNLKKKTFILAIIMISITFVLIKSDYFIADMQTNKFPPNLVFITYCFGILCLLLVFKSYILKTLSFVCKNKLINWIFNQFKDHAFTIYFFHTFGLYIVYLLMTKFYINIGNQCIIALINLILLILISSILGHIFGFIEKIRIFKND